MIRTSSHSGSNSSPTAEPAAHLTLRCFLAYAAHMELRGKKLGLLLSAAPDQPNFDRAITLAETATDAGVIVLLYCLDDAVTGISEARLQALRERGVRLFACAHAARRRGLAQDDSALFSSLTMIGDLMVSSDRFVSFN